MPEIPWWVTADLVILAGIGIYLLASYVRVGPEQYLQINWRFFLSPTPPPGHFIALGWQQGWRAKIYGPGLHFIPFIRIKFFAQYELKDFFEVSEGKFATIEALDGESLKPGQIVAEKIIDCRNFNDGEKFLREGGQRGPQVPILLTGKWAFNSRLFRLILRNLTIIDRTEQEIEIAAGKGEIRLVPQIAIVTLLTGGEEIPEEEERVLARKIKGHNNFQRLTGFIGADTLKNQRLENGIQPDVLEPAKYALNPFLISVSRPILAKFVKQGEVAVVISSEGREPLGSEIEYVGENTKGKSAYILTSGVSVAGLRGIWPQVYGPGFIPLHLYHPIAFSLVIVDTTPIRICWMTREEHKAHDDVGKTMRFDPILVITKDGFTVPVKAELIVNFSRINAPKVVALAGSGDGLINDIIVPIFDDAAKTCISRHALVNLLTAREQIRNEIQEAIKQATDNFPVTISRFRISEFDFEKSPDPEVPAFIDLINQKAVAVQQAEVFRLQIAVQKTRKELEEQRAIADNQVVRVAAEYRAIAASSEKEAITRRGEGIADVVRGLAAEGVLVKTVGIVSAEPVAVREAVGSVGKAVKMIIGKEPPEK